MSLTSMNPFLGSRDQMVAFFDGYVQLNSSGAVVASSGKWDGVSQTIRSVIVTKTANAGEYKFALDGQSCFAIKCAFAQVVASGAVDLVAQVESISSSAVLVRLLAGATPTTPSAACGISFLCVATDSSL